jgi:hypothetical protein
MYFRMCLVLRIFLFAGFMVNFSESVPATLCLSRVCGNDGTNIFGEATCYETAGLRIRDGYVGWLRTEASFNNNLLRSGQCSTDSIFCVTAFQAASRTAVVQYANRYFYLPRPNKMGTDMPSHCQLEYWFEI